MMKKLVYFTFLFFALVSCQKEDPLSANPDALPNFNSDFIPPGGGGGTGGGFLPPSTANGSFTADVDGISWRSKFLYVNDTLDFLTVIGVEETEMFGITIGIWKDTEAGTYSLSLPSIAAPYAFYTIARSQTDATYLYGEGPALEIVENDTIANRISGNFFFTGINPTDLSDSVVVSNGHFELNY